LVPVLASPGDGLLVLDDRRRCLMVNAEARRILGWSELELRGQPVFERLLGHSDVDNTGPKEKPQVAFDLLGRGVGNPPEVRPIASGPAVAFSEVGRYRAGRANHLIGNRLERSRDPQDQRDGVTSCLESLLVGDEVGVGEDVGHDHLRVVDVLPRAGAAADVKGAKHRASSPACP